MFEWRTYEIPPSYDATPATLRWVSRRSVAEGVFGDAALEEEDLDHATMRGVVRALLRHFAERELDDWYRIEFVRREEVPQMQGHYADGFNTGPFSFVPITHPFGMLSTAFHELGHAMFPSGDVNAKEVAAVYVAHLFTEKLIAERPSFAPMKRLLTSSLDDVMVQDLLRTHHTPEDLFPGRYSAEYVRNTPWLRELLTKGNKLQIQFKRSGR